MWLNAIWELVQGQIGQFIYGKDFKEGTLSILQRILGLLLPGIAGHMPTNYVNAIRLGPPILFRRRLGTQYMSKPSKYEMANGWLGKLWLLATKNFPHYSVEHGNIVHKEVEQGNIEVDMHKTYI